MNLAPLKEVCDAYNLKLMKVGRSVHIVNNDNNDPVKVPIEMLRMQLTKWIVFPNGCIF